MSGICVAVCVDLLRLKVLNVCVLEHPQNCYDGSPLHVQVQVPPPYTLDIALTTGLDRSNSVADDKFRSESLSGDLLTTRLAQKRDEFDKR
jgi:hypothetical protein